MNTAGIAAALVSEWNASSADVPASAAHAPDDDVDLDAALNDQAPPPAAAVDPSAIAATVAAALEETADAWGKAVESASSFDSKGTTTAGTSSFESLPLYHLMKSRRGDFTPVNPIDEAPSSNGALNGTKAGSKQDLESKSTAIEPRDKSGAADHDPSWTGVFDHYAANVDSIDTALQNAPPISASLQKALKAKPRAAKRPREPTTKSSSRTKDTGGIRCSRCTLHKGEWPFCGVTGERHSEPVFKRSGGGSGGGSKSGAKKSAATKGRGRRVESSSSDEFIDSDESSDETSGSDDDSDDSDVCLLLS